MKLGAEGDDTWGAKTKPVHMLDNSRELKYRFSFTGI
jgi:hypothetical protein